MPDRIPPRVDTPVGVSITGWAMPMLDVTLPVEGGGGGNGSVTLNGANSVDLNASAIVRLRGVDQTAPGNAGGLRLVARQGTALVASSPGFSVSAIPQNFSVTFNSQINTATMRGLHPEVRVVEHRERLTAANALERVGAVDLVLDWCSGRQPPPTPTATPTQDGEQSTT